MDELPILAKLEPYRPKEVKAKSVAVIPEVDESILPELTCQLNTVALTLNAMGLDDEAVESFWPVAYRFGNKVVRSGRR